MKASKMKLTWMMVFGMVFLAVEVLAQETPVLKTQKDKQSYAIGVEVTRNFKRQGFDLDLDLVIRGMKDAQGSDKLLLTNEEIIETLNRFGTEARARKAGDRVVTGQENKKAGEEFLAANKTKEGVVSLPSGLQYKIIKDGGGKKPTKDDTVEVHYRGTLVDGTEFESTYATGQTATTKVSDFRVIAGLREALELMPVGSKWQVFIPSQLAYGQRGFGRFVGPYAALIFEIEMLAIKQTGEKGGDGGEK